MRRHQGLASGLILSILLSAGAGAQPQGLATDPRIPRVDQETVRGIPLLEGTSASGFVRAEPAVSPGGFGWSADPDDIYRVRLRAGEWAVVRAQPDDGALGINLFLYDTGGSRGPAVVAAAMGESGMEAVQAPRDGDYMLVIGAAHGSGGYVLDLRPAPPEPPVAEARPQLPPP